MLMRALPKQVLHVYLLKPLCDCAVALMWGAPPASPCWLILQIVNAVVWVQQQGIVWFVEIKHALENVPFIELNLFHLIDGHVSKVDD